MNYHFITSRPYSDKENKDDLDRLQNFIAFGQDGRIDGWSARNTFEPGDLAFFYFALPKMTLEAVALVDSDPYVEELDDLADFSNPVFCDFAPLLILEQEVSIKSLLAKQPQLAKWWKTKPYQTIRRIDASIALALLQGISEQNPDDKDILAPLVEQLVQTVQPAPVKRTSRANPPSTRKQPQAKPKKKKWTSRDLMRLSWREFEILAADLFSHVYDDVTVKLGAGRADQGVDVFITEDRTNKVHLIQCKRFQPGNKVSSVDLRNFAGAMLKFNATKGYFVTSSSFNPYALEFVEDLPQIELIEGKELLKRINADDLIPSREDFQNNLNDHSYF